MQTFSTPPAKSAKQRSHVQYYLVVGSGAFSPVLLRSGLDAGSYLSIVSLDAPTTIQFDLGVGQ